MWFVNRIRRCFSATAHSYLLFSDSKAAFDIDPNAKVFIYVRVTDKAGNTAYINSDGVGIYTDSTANTERISFTRLSDGDVSFKLPYNGISFQVEHPDQMKIEYKLLGAEDSTYTTDAPRNAGSYTVRISVDADNGYNAATFTADFTISPVEVTINGVTAESKTYNGNTEAVISGGVVTGVTVASKKKKQQER